MNVNTIEIARHTIHDGKYDPRMLNVGGPEHPEAVSRNMLATRLIQTRWVFPERPQDW
jgi:hypothetical protein